jgi:hypothetical protein
MPRGALADVLGELFDRRDWRVSFPIEARIAPRDIPGCRPPAAGTAPTSRSMSSTPRRTSGTSARSKRS